MLKTLPYTIRIFVAVWRSALWLLILWPTQTVHMKYSLAEYCLFLNDTNSHVTQEQQTVHQSISQQPTDQQPFSLFISLLMITHNTYVVLRRKKHSWLDLHSGVTTAEACRVTGTGGSHYWHKPTTLNGTLITAIVVNCFDLNPDWSWTVGGPEYWGKIHTKGGRKNLHTEIKLFFAADFFALNFKPHCYVPCCLKYL